MEFKVIVTCKRGHTEEHNMEIAKWNFDFADYPCEMCGSHGNIKYEWECETCGTKNSIEIDGW